MFGMSPVSPATSLPRDVVVAKALVVVEAVLLLTAPAADRKGRIRDRGAAMVVCNGSRSEDDESYVYLALQSCLEVIQCARSCTSPAVAPPATYDPKLVPGLCSSSRPRLGDDLSPAGLLQACARLLLRQSSCTTFHVPRRQPHLPSNSYLCTTIPPPSISPVIAPIPSTWLRRPRFRVRLFRFPLSATSSALHEHVQVTAAGPVHRRR